MSKVLFLSFSIALIALVGCNSGGINVESEWTVYRSSMEHGDLGSATNSLNRIIAVDKYNADALDTLAVLYSSTGTYGAAAKVATRALNIRQSDVTLLVLAEANKNLGKYDVAIGQFSELLAKNPNDIKLLYNVAFTNINLNRLNDALPHIEALINHPNSGTEVMKEFNADGSQVLPYRAVAFNMLGFLQMQAGQRAEAAASFENALRIFPKYYLAQNNLRVLQSEQSAKAKK